MKLTGEQKQVVAQWLAAGASIADVQRRLREEFHVSLTYMDTRFLIDDLGLDLAAPPPPPPPAPAPKTAGKQPPPLPGGAPGAAHEDGVVTPEYIDDGDAYEDDYAPPPSPLAPGGAGSVKVEVDRVMRPGTVVSGSVTFSDGNSGTWALDQYGRLVFNAKTEGYRPSQADLQAFQRELSSQLQRQGY
jgi:hypothetical protein